jgi:hypothetical protein
MSMNQITPAWLINEAPHAEILNNSLCTCGDKEFDHRVGAKGKRGACRMCIRCKKFKLPKPIKAKKRA